MFLVWPSQCFVQVGTHKLIPSARGYRVRVRDLGFGVEDLGVCRAALIYRFAGLVG